MSDGYRLRSYTSVRSSVLDKLASFRQARKGEASSQIKKRAALLVTVIKISFMIGGWGATFK